MLVASIGSAFDDRMHPNQAAKRFKAGAEADGSDPRVVPGLYPFLEGRLGAVMDSRLTNASNFQQQLPLSSLAAQSHLQGGIHPLLANEQHRLLLQRYDQVLRMERMAALDQTLLTEQYLLRQRQNALLQLASFHTANPDGQIADRALPHPNTAHEAGVEKLNTKESDSEVPSNDAESTDDLSVVPPRKKDTKWLATYEQLKKYKADKGDCIVPRGYTANPRLASWVAEQRKQYKLLKDGKQSSITEDRIRLLKEIGFAWNAQEAAWTRHMDDLKTFRQETGHCHVPLNHEKYPKLGLWVKEQRRHYTLLRSGKQSHMTQKRIDELDAVGFCWDTHEATWLERLRELTVFRQKHGSCIVPTQHGKLGSWVHHQRRQYKKYKEGKPCHITEERIKQLNDLGFVWFPRTRANSCDDLSASLSSDHSASSSRKREREI